MTETSLPTKLFEQLEALCEGRLSASEVRELESTLASDAAARRCYLQYIDMHGALHWDTAQSDTEPPPPIPLPDAPTDRKVAAHRTNWTRQWWPITAGAVALLLIVGLGSALIFSWYGTTGENSSIADSEDADGEHATTSNDSSETTPQNPRSHRPVELPNFPRENDRNDASAIAKSPNDLPNDFDPPGTDQNEPLDVVSFANWQLRSGWDAAEIAPSARATDSEWLRRVYLHLLGHIPPPDVAERFLADRNPRKRPELIERLLAEPSYARNWSTLWTNLLIGRSSVRQVNRDALEKFLRESFAHNRPWNEIVYDLVSAEGNANENGAANYLLAHLNNEAVPATAITARLFLGKQIQCMQCHDHPTNEWTQNQFWEINSVFQQTDMQRRDALELVTLEIGGPIYYETRRGVMRAAFPQYGGMRIDSGAQTNRRREFARLIAHEDGRELARAMVNRVWQHFFGRGFTWSVADMGPHSPPTHPELLDRLAEEFIQSGYDLKQLIRWITATEAYHLSSRFGEQNLEDDPEAGYSPLFSRVYIRPMTAEQLYDSMIIATGAHQVNQSDWEAAESQRQRWLQQFITTFETDENDEAVEFDGTITQALLMMNGELVTRAIELRPGTYFHEVTISRASVDEKLTRLSLAAVSRKPSPTEIAAVRRLIRQRTLQHGQRDRAIVESLQDLFWALLNSNEFTLVP